MANRGPNVQYRNYAVSVGTPVGVDFLKNLCDIIAISYKEKTSDALVWNNPDNHASPINRMTVPTDTTDLNNYNAILSLKATIGDNQPITISFFNNLIGISKALESSVKTLFLDNDYVDQDSFMDGDVITATQLNIIVQNLNIISGNFNTTNSWWNPVSDACVRSCQVACQSGCQLACQGCYSGTCHNQNCGGWS